LAVPEPQRVLLKSLFAPQDLTEALIVNPFDPDAIADAMRVAHDAAVGTSGAAERAGAEGDAHDVEAYCCRFIEALEAPAVARAALGNQAEGRRIDDQPVFAV
jgi:trehalose 6-phosphate synthase